MDRDKNDPFRFVSYLFEMAVWPFQVAARTSARKLPLHDHQEINLILLYPAMIILPLVCLLISFLAILYVFFVALPIVFFGQVVPEYAPKIILPLLLVTVGLAAVAVVWGLFQGRPTFGVAELVLAVAVIVIVVGHQSPRIMRTMFRGSHP